MIATLARYGAFYATLRAAHDIGDHIVQTDHQAQHKARDWSAMAGHVGSYTALQAGALAAHCALTGHRPTWARLAGAVAFSAVSHAFLDRRWPVVAMLDATGSSGFARPLVRTDGDVREITGAPATVSGVGPLPLPGPYLADQAAHHGALALCAAILAGGR